MAVIGGGTAVFTQTVSEGLKMLNSRRGPSWQNIHAHVHRHTKMETDEAAALSLLLLRVVGQRRPGGAAVAAKLLDSPGASADICDADGFSLLAKAARAGDEAMVSLLLSKGARTDLATKENGNTPLLWAAGSNHVAVLRLLLGHRAEPMAQRNIQGDTALLWACRSGACESVSALLDVAAPLLTTSNNLGMTPLMCAAAGGHAVALKLLVTFSHRLAAVTVPVDARDKHGRTALHFAAAAESGRDCALLLLGAGADWSVRDEHGLTPLGEATKCRY